MKNKRESKHATCKECGETIQAVLSPYENQQKQRDAIFSGFCGTRCAGLNSKAKSRSTDTPKAGNEAKRSDHTPTPWQVADYETFLAIRQGEKRIATKIESPADAYFIVRAVNAYGKLKADNDEMLAALLAVRNEYRAYVLSDPRNLDDAKGSRILAQIDRAVASATGSGANGIARPNGKGTL